MGYTQETSKCQVLDHLIFLHSLFLNLNAIQAPTPRFNVDKALVLHQHTILG